MLGNRSLFPTLAYPVYLAHAGCSPLSTRVLGAIAEHTALCAAQGAAGVEPILAQRERVRGLLGQLLHTKAEQIAFVSSVSWGLNAVAHCFPWKAGDRVLLLRGEFPANVTPWQRAAEQYGLEIVWLEAEDFRSERGLESLEILLQAGVRLMAMSAVEFQTGLRLPLEEITRLCKAAGTVLAVDVIQAAGVVPFEVGDIDIVVGGSHKWLMGIEGLGYVYTRPGLELLPRLGSWLSHQDAVNFLFLPGELRYDRPFVGTPRFLEMSTMSSIAVAALEASLGLLLEIGVSSIFEHVTGYLDELEEGLLALGYRSLRSPLRSGILALEVEDPGTLSHALLDRGICCSSPDGRLRMAPHWPNSRAEIPLMLEALRR